MVLLPLEPLATTTAAARGREDQLRAALARGKGICLEERSRTLAKLSGGGDAFRCSDRLCRAALSERLDADWILSGSVVGLGGREQLSLVAWDRSGQQVRRLVLGAGEGTGGLVFLLEDVPAPRPPRSRLSTYLLAGAGLAAAAVGTGLGMSSSQRARAISEGRTGCAGGGTEYQQCFAGVVSAGRSEATVANGLFGAAVLLGGGAAVLLVVEIP